jgi:hypothetical protein
VLTRRRRCLGEVPERSNGAVSKTVVPLAGDRGFESLPLRQSIANQLRRLTEAAMIAAGELRKSF